MRLSDLPAVMAIEVDNYLDPWQDEMFYQEIKFGTAFVLEEALSSQILGYVCGIQVLDEFSLTNISVKKD